MAPYSFPQRALQLLEAMAQAPWGVGGGVGVAQLADLCSRDLRGCFNNLTAQAASCSGVVETDASREFVMRSLKAKLLKFILMLQQLSCCEEIVPAAELQRCFFSMRNLNSGQT